MEVSSTRVPFQFRHFGRLGQVCNPSGSFRPNQDKIRLILEVRGFISLIGPDGIGSPDSQIGRTVQSSLKDF